MKQFYVLLLLFSVTFAFSQKEEKVIDSLKKSLQKGNEKQRFQMLSLLSDEYSKFDLDKALYYANQSLQKAKKIKNDTFVGLAYNAIANTYQYRSELDSALHFHQKALKVRQKLKDSLGIADSYNNIGITYDNKCQFQEALESYFKALYYYDKKADYAKMAMVYTNIGIVYKLQKEYKKALSYYRKAYALYLRAKEDFGITVSSGNLGSILINFEKYEESLSYSEIAKKGYEKLGYDRFIGYPVSNIAVVYDSLHQFEKANSNYLLSLQLHEEHDNAYEAANVSNAYANCLIKQKKYNESIVFSKKAIVLSKEADAFLLEVQADENLSKAYSKLGNYKEAYRFSNLYNIGKDSLYVHEKTKAIFELEAKYETAKKEKLLVQKEAEAKKRNILVIILLLSVIFAIAIGYLIFRQQKLKNRQQEQEFQLKSAISQIETQNKLHDQRLSISRDLHDNIGAQLTFIISSMDNIKYAFDLKNTKLDSKLESISNFTKATIVELRDTIWAMNSDQITFEDLRLRIFNLIEKAKTAKEDVVFKFNIDAASRDLKFTSIKGMNIFRMIQEAINNSIKYSNATEILVEVCDVAENLEIIISDNGIGFDQNEVLLGNGLQNMKKRLKDIDGTFEIESKSGIGTTIKATIIK